MAERGGTDKVISLALGQRTPVHSCEQEIMRLGHSERCFVDACIDASRMGEPEAWHTSKKANWRGPDPVAWRNQHFLSEWASKTPADGHCASGPGGFKGASTQDEFFEM